jgi:hypothetical protein
VVGTGSAFLLRSASAPKPRAVTNTALTPNWGAPTATLVIIWVEIADDVPGTVALHGIGVPGVTGGGVVTTQMFTTTPPIELEEGAFIVRVETCVPVSPIGIVMKWCSASPERVNPLLELRESEPSDEHTCVTSERLALVHTHRVHIPPTELAEEHTGASQAWS